MNKLKCRNLENFGQLNESQQMMASVWRVPPPTSIFSYFRHCKHLPWALYCIVLYPLFFNCGLSFLLAQYLYLCYLFGFSPLSSVMVMFKTLSPSLMPGATLPSWSCSPYLMYFNPSAWALYFIALSLFFMSFLLAQYLYLCYLFGFSFLSSVMVMFKTLSLSPMSGATLPSWSCSPYLMHFNPSAWALYFVLSLFFMAFQLARHFFFCYQLISSPLYTYSDGL